MDTVEYIVAIEWLNNTSTKGSNPTIIHIPMLLLIQSIQSDNTTLKSKACQETTL